MRAQFLDTNHRLFLLLVALAVVINLLNGGMAILTEPTSWSYKVANLTMYGPAVIGGAFLISAILLVPFVLSMSQEMCSRFVVKLATAGCGFGSVTCMGMGYMARNLDLGWFQMYYVICAIFSLMAAGGMAVLLNNEMVRRHRLGRA